MPLGGSFALARRLGGSGEGFLPGGVIHVPMTAAFFLVNNVDPAVHEFVVQQFLVFIIL